MKNCDQKPWEKKDQIGDFRYLEVLEVPYSRIVRQIIWRKTVAFSFFYSGGSDKRRQSDPEWKWEGNIVLDRQGLH